MTIHEHVKEFAGKQVVEWDEERGIADPERSNYRISLDWDAAEEGQLWTDKFAAFLEDPNAERVTGLIVGNWGEVSTGDSSETVVEALTAAREQLPNLTALFLGDVTTEESEISWIVQSDVSPLFSAYPRLEVFCVRGGQGLRFGALSHAYLKSLTVETGGLPVEPLREILSAQLPALEHLELWLGTEEYGWNGSLIDLMPLLQGGLFPNLQALGLRDSEIADELAAALANAPILHRIRVLDLSLGTLSDTGAEALLSSPYLPRTDKSDLPPSLPLAGKVTVIPSRLEKLDVHHHYLSEEMMRRLEALPIRVDVSERQEEDEYRGERYRYVAVGE